jgi:hypothetical protein
LIQVFSQLAEFPNGALVPWHCDVEKCYIMSLSVMKSHVVWYLHHYLNIWIKFITSLVSIKSRESWGIYQRSVKLMIVLKISFLSSTISFPVFTHVHYSGKFFFSLGENSQNELSLSQWKKKSRIHLHKFVTNFHYSPVLFQSWFSLNVFYLFLEDKSRVFSLCTQWKMKRD